MNPKIERFLRDRQPETPCLVVDLSVVKKNYQKIRRELPLADVYYAVKANPAPDILKLLVGLGSYFDAASGGEISQCLASGAKPERISYGNVIKKERDIAEAFSRGVRLYAFDSEAELLKLAAAAPGSQVYCRILVPNQGADWPLSRKFGCDLTMARDLMIRARDLGLQAYGISFHVGSQQHDAKQWDIALARTAMVFTDLRNAGIELKMVNLGGGFPVQYRENPGKPELPSFKAFAAAIMKGMTRHFGNDLPRMLIEPGRAIAAEAGVIETEVVLIARKSYDDPLRWVYLDVGMFGGLAETMNESIQYAFRTPADGRAESPVAIAGPTCDGVDILYEKAGYTLPVDLKIGDRVQVLRAGAYTTTYASVGFNGFLPLKEHYI